ncbi:MAG: methionine--tRNA ligase [Nanoarchaeota archaeon]|nr:methionine--tRNA ligase [Nanoarchaeota archaeon]
MKVLVCSAWPYCSNVPHLGNLLGSLLSGDVFARYYRLKGYDILYVSGTDMHGTRTEFEALKKGISPKELAEENHKKIKEIIEKFNIKFDNYTSTESKTHKEFVKEIYQKIKENGYIFTKIEKRAFCENCGIFLADAFIVGTCPKCGYEHAKGNQCEKCGSLLEPEELINPHCKVCGKTNIVFKETKHWYLDLEKLQPEIEKYVKSHPEWSDNVKNFTLNLIKAGLKPRAITRDLKWGIPAPFEGAEGKVIYVWAEAALGYVSATIEYFNGKDDWKKYWFGEDVKQIYTIGKDNIPFHTIMFPAQLIATKQGFHLPDEISATEYLNWEQGKKFSKSMNIGLFADEALKLLPAPYWRFYLLYDRPETRDTNFSWLELEKSINLILIGDFANLVSRVLKFLEKNYELKVPNAELDDEDKALLDKINVTADVFSEIIESGQIRDAIDTIVNLCREANKYFQQREPWKNKEKKDQTIYVCIQIIKALAVMLYPIIPSISEKLWKILNINKEISWEEINNELKPGHRINSPEPLIEKIDIKKLKEEYAKLKGTTS